ncbi:hypothetical protein QVD17_21727 [Tagetes erecta]|uniref:DNA-directed RNA polymerase n=1 Tax=Tagetes erecta TaxID=13708 RepID=A0AAD8NT58_TARER|nr:hypothetical protein QVD17_21727 [Tagetes erecta]
MRFQSLSDFVCISSIILLFRFIIVSHRSTGLAARFRLVMTYIDKWLLVYECMKVNGFVSQHVDSFNHFTEIEIKNIIRANNEVLSGYDDGVYIRYTDVWVGKPSEFRDGVIYPLNPQECRLSDKTYAAPIYVNIEYRNGLDSPIMKKKDVVIGRMPIMLRSRSCVLHGKDEEELTKLGECPLDPGGYFVVKGKEKVFLLQEQLSKNRIILESDKKGCIQASVMSSTAMTKSKTTIKMENEKIYLVLNAFTSKVPILIVMKAMGMETDQEVVQMLGRDPQYATLLLPSIEECHNNGVYTQMQALSFLETQCRKSRFRFGQDDGPQGILRDIFLSNVPVQENNLHKKCQFAAVMMRRVMDATLYEKPMDDKDYIGNKRLQLTGELLALLFEDVFKSMNYTIKLTVDKSLSKASRSSEFDISRKILKDHITSGLERSLLTGNWDISQFRMHKKGVTQTVTRLSFIGAFASMTKTSPQLEKSKKASESRALHCSQFGMFCPCDTPVGEACGLVKHLALMSHITIDENEGPIINLCHCLGVEDLSILSGDELHSTDSFLVILNGSIVGKHRRPELFANGMRKLRRAGRVGDFVSIYVHEKQRCVYIASDGGRVCRPLVIADNGVSRIKHCHMNELKDGARNFDSFLRDGLLEYLDVNEQNNALIAVHEGEATSETTHIEIESSTILGVCAGLIPFPHHNLSTGNTYQCAIGKQAMGNIAYNQLCRMDTVTNLLVYPQRPLLTTRTIELVGYDKLGAGQNATVAVMSYSGYDLNDAIVMNKSSLDRGFGRCIVMKTMSDTYQKYDHACDQMVSPHKSQHDPEKTQILDNDGLASPGEIIRHQDIYLQKECPENPRTKLHPSQVKYRTSKQTYKGAEGEPAVVDRVALCSDRGQNLVVKCVFRHTRRPEVGDKFSCRHGQKGVCGIIVQQQDLPFSESGICPDLLINPHGFSNGRTVGKMLELLGSKAGASCGKFHYGSAFGEPSGHAHKDADMRYPWYATRSIYIHRADILPETKAHGVRLGEPERDCLIAYGTSNLIYERLMISSDSFEAQVCRNCGLLGYMDYQTNTRNCSTCKNGDNVSPIKVPYAWKLLLQELQSMNIVPRMELNDS